MLTTKLLGFGRAGAHAYHRELGCVVEIRLGENEYLGKKPHEPLRECEQGVFVVVNGGAE
jgi:hypothetical protein